MVYGEKSAKGGRRGSFVNASRHRSSHSLPSHASSRSVSPGPKRRKDESSKQGADHEPSPDSSDQKPSRLTWPLTKSPSSNSSSLQTFEDRREGPFEGNPLSREIPFFPFTRRSSQIRPILSPIESSYRVASAERSGARVSLDDISGTRVLV